MRGEQGATWSDLAGYLGRHDGHARRSPRTASNANGRLSSSTRVRAIGVDFTYSCSRLSAALSSLLIGRVLLHDVPTVFALICSVMVGVAVVVTLLGPNTNRRVLEQNILLTEIPRSCAGRCLRLAP